MKQKLLEKVIGHLMKKLDTPIPLMQKDTVPYAVASAIRGPDNDKSNAGKEYKRLLTIRIRHTIFTSFEDGDDPCVTEYTLYDIDGTPFSEVDLQALVNLKNVKDVQHLSHYLSHLISAIDTTRYFNVWNGYEDKIIEQLFINTRSHSKNQEDF